MEPTQNTERLHNRDIEWHFNLPAASYAGGVWERMICLIRITLRSLLGNQLVHDEILLTLIMEVEKILNNRPLTLQQIIEMISIPSHQASYCCYDLIQAYLLLS